MVMKMAVPIALVWVVEVVSGRQSTPRPKPQTHCPRNLWSSAPETPPTQNTAHKILVEYVPCGPLCQGVEGFQNMPLQNMPLWHTDYFELKPIEDQQMQEKL